MRVETRACLHDIAGAADLIAEFTAGRRYADYVRDAMLRAAVERQFEIVGEALAQLVKLDIEVAVRISHYRSIIGFRNILVHAYAKVDDRLVWDAVEGKLPLLRREVGALARTL